MQFLYDITKSFEENYLNGPLIDNNQNLLSIKIQKNYKNFFGYSVASNIGIPACAIMTSKGINYMAQQGYDILTYKTIRSSRQEAYSPRNIYFVDGSTQLSYQNQHQTISITDVINLDKLAITNSFGNSCFDQQEIMRDIECARNLLLADQLLIVSVFGQKNDRRTVAQDFAYTAAFAQEAGAQLIEANISCPNLSTTNAPYQQLDFMYNVITTIKNSISIPLIIKVGIEMIEFLDMLLPAIAHAEASGICGINSVPMRVVNDQLQPIFGNNRIISGVSGNPIRNLALQFTQHAREVIDREKLNLTLLATGGIIKPQHFDDFFNAGADIALSATGAMFNPMLAIDYHKLRQQ